MDEQEARARKIQTLVEPILEAGDRYVIQSDEEGAVAVLSAAEEDARSLLATTHPRFYGYMLAASERIGVSSGCGLTVIYLLAAAVVCFSIHARVLHAFFPVDAEGQKVLELLRTWWVYGIVTVAVLLVWGKHEGTLEARAYQRERGELGEHLARERLNPYEALAQIEGDEHVSTLGKHMKLDVRLGALAGV
jgi:hypothetical protein